MTKTRKSLVWALAIVTSLFAIVVAALVYGLPPVITSWVNRTVTEPTPKDYVVYSAFVDGFFSNQQPFPANQNSGQDHIVYVVEETRQMRSPGPIPPLQLAALGPSDMVEDFFRQNARTWRLQPRFETRLRVVLVGSDMAHRASSVGEEELFEKPKKGDELKPLPDASHDKQFPEIPSASGVLQLSRAGFNRRETVAILYYSYRCGALCGQSGWVVLNKAEGTWRIKQFGSGVVY